MNETLAAIATEIQDVTLTLARNFGDFLEVRDQNGCLYVAELRGCDYVAGSVRRTW